MKKDKKAFIHEKYIYIYAILIGIIFIISFSYVAVNDVFYLFDKDIDLRINSSYKINISSKYPVTDFHISVENPDIAEIDENGTIKAKKIGETKVIVKSKHKLFTNEINLNVSDFTIYSIVFEEDNINLLKGQKSLLDPIINNDSTIKNDLVWSSSDENVVTVNENGTIVGVSEGNAVITAYEEDSKIESKVNVIVGTGKITDDNNNIIASVDEEPEEVSEEEEIMDVDGITLNTKSLNMYIGDIKKVSATVTPQGASASNLKYESSDTSVATVNKNGLIVAKKKGVCNIFVSSSDDKVSTSLVVRVIGDKIPVKSLKFNDKTINLDINENYMLVPVIEPSNASITDVTYSSSNEMVATIDSNGKIHAVNEGTATIVGVTKEGHYSSSVQVFVSNKQVNVSKIIESEITGLENTMVSGSSSKISVKLLNDRNEKVKYIITSSNKEVIKVNQNNTVIAINYGIASINIDAVDGSFSQSHLITVLPGDVSPELIYLNKSQAQLVIGTTLELSATVVPENADNKTIAWSSSNEKVAIVDSNGIVTAKGVGSCNIVAQVKGTGIKRSIKISVVNKDKLIDVRKQKLTGYYTNLRVYDKGTNFMRAMQNFAIYNQGTANELVLVSMPTRTLVKSGIKLTGELKKDLTRTIIVRIPKSEVKNPASKKRNYMFLNSTGHGQALDLQTNGTIWTNGNGFVDKDANGSYWGESKSLLSVKFKSNKENSTFSPITKITIKDTSTKQYLTNLEISFDWTNNLAAVKSGRKVFIYNAKNFISGKLNLLYSFNLNVKSADGTNYSRQGFAINNGYYYQYRGVAGSKMYIEVYNYVGELQYTYIFNPKLSGQEAEGLKIYNNKVFVGVVYSCKGCNGKTNAIYYFK